MTGVVGPLELRPAQRSDMTEGSTLVWQSVGQYLLKITEAVTPGYCYRATVVQVLVPGLFRPGRQVTVFADETEQTTDFWAFAERDVVPTGEAAVA